jgi:hypothetical protein
MHHSFWGSGFKTGRLKTGLVKASFKDCTERLNVAFNFKKGCDDCQMGKKLVSPSKQGNII